MTQVLNGVRTLDQRRQGVGNEAFIEVGSAWVASACPHCGGGQALLIGTVDSVQWLRCVTCLSGAVNNAGTVSPSTRPLRRPENLPPQDLLIWEEARACLGSGAYMATVMLCRKLLLHIAVANGLAPEDARGYSPGFAECVAHLETAGVITKNMLEFVEPIKDVGNAANHKIVAVTQEQAEAVAKFTEHLLVIAYELKKATKPTGL